MCGRYSLHATPSTLADRFDVAFPEDFEPRYNCAPGQELPVITDGGEVRRMEWGLTPSWADESFDLINARAETLTEKRSFADAYRARRCLVPVTGFYEWTEVDGHNQPFRVAFADDRPFAVAGLWERWSPPTRQSGLGEFGVGDGDGDDEVRETFTIVTTEPNDLLSRLHHRMSVVLPPDREDDWLHAEPPEDDGVASAHTDLLTPYPDDELVAYPVSTDVNAPSTDASHLHDRVADVDVPPELDAGTGPSAGSS